MTRRLPLTTLKWALLLSSTACLDAPSKIRTSGSLKHAAAAAVEVAVVERADGSVQARLEPSESIVQVVKAAANSPIAGATVSFPPGTLSLATDISVAVGSALVADAESADLIARIPVAAAAPSVTVASTVALTLGGEIELAIPLPATASLVAADPFANIVVLYKFMRSDGAALGVYLRDQIVLRDGFAVFLTRHFGTFQAVLLRAPLLEQREVAVVDPPSALPPPAPNPPAVAATVRRVFAPGFATTSFMNDVVRQDGLWGRAAPFAPSRVTNGDASLLEGIRAYRTKGE